MKTLSFYSICPASSHLTLVSPRITHAYRFKRIRARFVAGCNDLMKLRFLIGNDKAASTTAVPSGLSILAEYGQVDYIVGDDDAKDMNNWIDVVERGSYIKVHAENGDTSEHRVDVQIEIEPANTEG